MNWYGNGNFTRPRKAKGGIKARSEEGEFAKNWWAKKWLQAMERLTYTARLQRGQRYARSGQVTSLNEGEGGVIAKVQGSRAAPYKVTISLKPFTSRQWEKVLEVFASQAIFAAQLLAGEMPENIEEAFSAAGVNLFPVRSGDLATHCTCPDWANPCKHVAAVHYILGDRFDEDPFLLFRLRGRSQEQILDGLRKRRNGEIIEEEIPPEDEAEVEESERIPRLEENMEQYWNLQAPLDEFSVNIQPPAITLPALKRLGEPDLATKLPLQEILSDAYIAVSQAALTIAYHTFELPPVEEEGDTQTEE